MRLIRSVGKWVDQRLQLGAPIRETMDHPIPRETASWAYVFGSAAMTAFALQLVLLLSSRLVRGGQSHSAQIGVS
jgi:ubiquinol-cytochrome c reductase cytochrome b subunit